MSAENVGKRARWSTVRPNSGGLAKPHDGTIVAFVSSYTTLSGVIRSRKLAHVNASAADRVSFDRYLVREDRGNSTSGNPYAPKWYAPRASSVEIDDATTAPTPPKR